MGRSRRMSEITFLDVIRALGAFLSGGALIGMMSEFRQRRKDQSTDKHDIVNQFQENMDKQSLRIAKLEEQNEELFNKIFSLQEEVRETKTKKEQAEFLLAVQKEASHKLKEDLLEEKESKASVIEQNTRLIQENERLRIEVMRLEKRLRELHITLEEDT